MTDLIEAIEIPTALDTQLWLVNLEQSVEPDHQHGLADWELERAVRFRFQNDAKRYLVAHVALRQILGQHLKLGPHQIPLETTELGKPFIAGYPVHFNMSHSGDWALIGLNTRQIIGVDIEVYQAVPEIDRLAKHNYTASEYSALQATKSPLDAFFTCWTRKEACLKAIGSGFSIEPQTFEAGITLAAETVHIKTASYSECSMVVCNIDLDDIAAHRLEMPRLFGALAVIAPQHSDRVY